MPKLVSEMIFAGYPLVYFDFSKVNVAISQTAVALKTNENAATTGALDVTGFIAPWAGSIVGLTIQLDANKTAGVLTLTPTINGTAITTPTDLVAVAQANAAQKTSKVIDAQQGGARFVAGDMLGIKHTSDASLAPTTLDMIARLWVIFEYVQP